MDSEGSDRRTGCHLRGIRAGTRGLIRALFFLLLVLVPITASSANAQVRPDSVRTDTLRRPGAPIDSAPARRSPEDSARNAAAQRRIDSLVAFRRGDTIKAPIARFEKPFSYEIDERLRFTRDQILTSEATNLSELLALVPGVTHYATGWLASAHMAAYAGNFARIRVFIDGMEMDNNDTRSNGILDFSEVHRWTLDEIVIERAAGEVRVWCRTSTVNRTTPYTRTDVFTGDLNTNGFRGLFAKRFMNGATLQVMGQQFATQQGRQSAFDTQRIAGRGDGANQTLVARSGWARRRFSADVYGVVTTRDRDEQSGLDSNPPIPAYKAARREGYIRFGYGDTSTGLWSQVILGSMRTRLEGIRTSGDTSSEQSDTTRSREQKVFAVGYRTKSMQLSFTERMRTFEGKSYNSPSVRYGFTSKRLSAGAYAESMPLDSSYNVDGTVRFAPTEWTAISLSHSRRLFSDYADRATDRDSSSLTRDDETVTRLEAGLRWQNRWITAGLIRQSAFRQIWPSLLVDTIGRSLAPAGNGYTVGFHGRLYKEIGLDLQGTHWDTPGDEVLYRPQTSIRSDLYLTTNWLSRFPKGEFGINAHVIYENRSPIKFNYRRVTDEGTQLAVNSLRAQIYTGLLEIRIQRATIFYHFHNMSGQAYELVPGIVMPRQVQMYGVRWEFWN